MTQQDIDFGRLLETAERFCEAAAAEPSQDDRRVYESLSVPVRVYERLQKAVARLTTQPPAD